MARSLISLTGMRSPTLSGLQKVRRVYSGALRQLQLSIAGTATIGVADGPLAM